MEEVKGDLSDSRRSNSVAESSFQEPYFNNPEVVDLPSGLGNMPQIEIFGNKACSDLYSISTLSQTNKNASNSPLRTTNADKKFTLRDYLNLKQLSSRKKITEPLSERPQGDKDSESSPTLTSAHSSRRRKVQSTESELHSSLRNEICKDIRSVQNQLSTMLKMLEISEDGEEEPC